MCVLKTFISELEAGGKIPQNTARPSGPFETMSE